MKIQSKNLNDRQRIETLDALYTAAGSLRGREAMKLFLRDLLTESERIMLGRRILIARHLLAGETALDIGARLGVGTDTIYRVQKWLEDELPGYEQALSGMDQEFAKRKRKAQNAAGFAALKRKYPLHFLFFPWPKGYPEKLYTRQNLHQKRTVK